MKKSIEWLKSPSKFHSITIETYPDEVVDGQFFIEDVVVQTATEAYQIYQLKHRQQPDIELWVWDDLLNQRKGKSGKLLPSLVQKWASSLQNLGKSATVEVAAFVTNGKPDAELNRYLIDDKVDLNSIQTSDKDLYDRIVEQIGDHQQAQAFFNQFTFVFNQLSEDQFDEDLQLEFCRELKGTRSGYLNVKNYIYKEANRPLPQPLTLTILREMGEWDHPQPLNEEFHVPDDFVLFDANVHEELIERIKSEPGGIGVFTGKPGTGKSTYLSSLAHQLAEQEVIVVKHHYHISTNDPYGQERLNNERITQALKYQFKQHEVELEEKAFQNSSGIKLSEFIAQVATHQHRHGKNFVLIIDGLDHVLRYWKEAELKDFLLEVSQPQNGLWLLFGTQEVAKKYLPQIIIDKCPEPDWYIIPGLDYSSTAAVIEYNSAGLNLPLNDLDKTVDKIFNLTEGNPLHLRYTLQALKNQLGNTVAYHFNLISVATYKGDISNYYRVLWASLPEYSKTAALIASSMNIGLTKKQLIEILNFIEPNPSIINNSVANIYHLLKEQFFGALTIYHNSFRIFIESQVDFVNQKFKLYKIIQNWLSVSTYDYLKWAELEKIHLQLDNPEPIIRLNREWTINSILDNRREEDIEHLLKIAKNTAFKEKDFPTSIQQNILYAIINNTFDYNDTEYPDLWKVIFQNRKDVEIPSDLDLETLPSYQVYYYIKYLHKQGHTGVRRLAFDIFKKRLNSQRYREKTEYNDDVPHTPKYVLKVMCLDKMYPVERAVSLCIHFRPDNWSVDLLLVYLKELTLSKQHTNIRKLLEQNLEDFERQKLLDFLIKEDCFNQVDEYTNLLRENQDILSVWGSLWWQIKTGYFVREKLQLPDYELLPPILENYDSKKRTELKEVFHQLWLNSIALVLGGEEPTLKKWLSGITNQISLQAGAVIAKTALHVAEQILAGKTINVVGVISKLNQFVRPRWEDDTKQFAIGRSFNEAASEMIWNCYYINCQTHRNKLITLAELEALLISQFISEEILLQFLINQKISVLEQVAYEELINREFKDWRSKIVTFSERSKRYIVLAKLASFHNDNRRLIDFARLAADNLLGYGYHKDLTLYNVLRSVRACFRAGSNRALEWMYRLAPLATWIGDFTDGDETRELIHDYHEQLSEIDIAASQRFYYQMLIQENFDIAESSWTSLIKFLPINTPQSTWLAATAVDSASYRILKKRAETENNGNRALEFIEKTLGPRQEFERESSSSSSPYDDGVFDYESVSPSDIEDYLAKLKEGTFYRSRSMVGNWAQHWLTKPDQDREELFTVLSNLVNNRGWEEQTVEFYDTIYSLAYEFDEEFAFQCLVQGQKEYSEWDPFGSSDRIRIHHRWQRLKEDFPNRYLEFFSKSVKDHGYRNRGQNNYFVPFPKGIEFFIFMGDLQLAEDITEASVRAVKELMADLELPTCEWIESPEKDEVDLLLARQLWASTITRERVATALAMLIHETLPHLTIYERWLAWLSEQTIETVIANGLLPILKYTEVPGGDFSFINLEKINQAVTYTTIASEQLLRELARLVGNSAFRINSKRRSPFIIPPDYEMNANFKKLAGRFLTPIYSSCADKAEKKFNGIFWRSWSYIVDQILKIYNITADIQAFIDFFGRRSDKIILTGMAPMATEAYRTAFLLRVQELHKLKLIENWQYHEFTYQTVPVDLSLWKLRPQRCPAWWPVEHSVSNKTSAKSKQLDVSKSDIHEQIQVLINTTTTKRIIALDGPLIPTSGWDKPSEIRITLVPFAYRITGSNLPSAEEINHECHFIFGPFIFLSPAESQTRPFNYLETEHMDLLDADSLIKIKDMLVSPLVGRFYHTAINMFQAYRHTVVPFGLFYNLKGDLNLTITDQAIDYTSENGVIAQSYDWTEGIAERRNYYLDEPHGQILEISRQYLDDYLNWFGLKLGFILCVEHTIVEEYKDSEDKIRYYELLNISRIIEPTFPNQ